MRRMTWSWILKLLVGLAGILTVGAMSTRLLVSDGLEEFTGESRTIAQDALTWGESRCRDHPINHLVSCLLSEKIRVVEVHFGPGVCPEADPAAPLDYQAVLHTYTFFGILTRTITIRCRELNCGF